jgi:hypothetical protein
MYRRGHVAVISFKYLGIIFFSHPTILLRYLTCQSGSYVYSMTNMMTFVSQTPVFSGRLKFILGNDTWVFQTMPLLTTCGTCTS